MILLEKQIGPIWLIEELKRAEARKPGSWVAVWKEIFGEAPGAEQEFLQHTETLDESIKLLEDLLPLYDELANLTNLPWKEFDAQYSEFVKKGTAANRFFGALIPAVAKFVDSQRRRTTQIALFKTAIAVVEGGPDKVKRAKTPSAPAPLSTANWIAGSS